MYIKTPVDRKDFPIRCPILDCSEHIPDSNIERICEKDIYQKYLRFQLDNFVELNPHMFRYCPSPDCQYVFKWSPKSSSCKHSCPSCAKTYCLRCKVPWHEGWTCKEFSPIKKASANDQMFYKLAKESSFQQCSRCKFWVQKKAGCNHITCKCGYEFCYMWRKAQRM
ncbi:unnamed protein product [Moneuplotes crassus]|uniref:RBR-type E3 ubiquitin transferase n=1 Tax=Euplotes crassus TaxID=5936 RepID=A0AAD1XEP5_EUPCR|nr:unnamed protein product [Moneuplotes crassus]